MIQKSIFLNWYRKKQSNGKIHVVLKYADDNANLKNMKKLGNCESIEEHIEKTKKVIKETNFFKVSQM